MSFFSLLTMFGGLAMFLYGMRLMGDGLKESSSGTLKVAMEHVTNNAFKAFLLGVAVTAIIQSSTATIVITSGLVAAGIISLKQSLGIVVGANVGTTVTGQIIRLLDIDNSAGAILQFFKPSTLAPIALIIGIVLIMAGRFKNAKVIGNIAIGFGILFSGLLNMTNAVDALGETGIFESLFSQLGSNPLLGYLTGATVAFILQSSSATIGILQAFSASGQLVFNEVYAVIVGVYLGDCVTTAIVCSIGAKEDAKRVGIVNILYNLNKSVLVLLGIFILRKFGVLDGIWNEVVNSGRIANANSIFNLSCAILLLPMIPVFEKLSYQIVKPKPEPENKYKNQLEELNPVFYSTPALALGSAHDVLMTQFLAAKKNVQEALGLIHTYDAKKSAAIQAEEDNIDLLTDRTTRYLADLSGHLTQQQHIDILNEYYKLVNEFERLGDYAVNIAEIADHMHTGDILFSSEAVGELNVLQDLIEQILSLAEAAFASRNVEAAMKIEPLEEVVDDLVEVLRDNHLGRLVRNECTVLAGTNFMNLLGEIERVSDICSNIGLATVSRVMPEKADNAHDYAEFLHSGQDEAFNREYEEAHKQYFDRINRYIKPVSERNPEEAA